MDSARSSRRIDPDQQLVDAVQLYGMWFTAEPLATGLCLETSRVAQSQLDVTVVETPRLRQTIGIDTSAGIFGVAAGRTIYYSRNPKYPEAISAYVLAGRCLGAILHQRGKLVLHGAVVRTPNGGCVAFLGDSGAGKSTLASMCYAAGHALVADELLAMSYPSSTEPKWLAIPGAPRLKLETSTAQAWVFATMPSKRFIPTSQSDFTNSKITSTVALPPCKQSTYWTASSQRPPKGWIGMRHGQENAANHRTTYRRGSRHRAREQNVRGIGFIHGTGLRTTCRMRNTRGVGTYLPPMGAPRFDNLSETVGTIMDHAPHV